MIKPVLVVACAMAISGCTHTVVKTEIVTVDKPIPFIPAPPSIPKFNSQVDQLTAADQNDPGKVGQAYKYDMVQLRQLVKVYEQVLQQYTDSAKSLDQLKGEIDKLFDDVNKGQKPQ